MEIKRELPQFIDQYALLVVTGNQEAILYSAHGGIIDEISKFEIPNPHYSDNEGYSERHGGMGNRMIIGSGGQKDDYRDEIARDFIKQCVQEIVAIARQNVITDIYLYSPEETGKLLIEHLPKELAKHIKNWQKGIYVKEHPFELLEMISST